MGGSAWSGYIQCLYIWETLIYTIKACGCTTNWSSRIDLTIMQSNQSSKENSRKNPILSKAIAELMGMEQWIFEPVLPGRAPNLGFDKLALAAVTSAVNSKALMDFDSLSGKPRNEVEFLDPAPQAPQPPFHIPAVLPEFYSLRRRDESVGEHKGTKVGSSWPARPSYTCLNIVIQF